MLNEEACKIITTRQKAGKSLQNSGVNNFRNFDQHEFAAGRT